MNIRQFFVIALCALLSSTLQAAPILKMQLDGDFEQHYNQLQQSLGNLRISPVNTLAFVMVHNLGSALQ